MDRPLITLRRSDRDPGRPKPKAPVLSQANCHDFSWSAEELIDRIDYELSKITFLGDDYPHVSLTTFGPGIMAAMCGAVLDNSSGRCWFHPRQELPIERVHMEYDPENPWLLRIKDICRAAVDRWQGQVLMQMPDLGGNMDILASFLTTEQLLFALYDHPEEVKRLIEEEHRLWFQYYEEISGILQPKSPGYTDWAGIFSDRPSYVLQCDFAYMISPEQFDEFVKPELEASCDQLGNTMYHLDGKGQLPHLGSLLTINKLGAVQWVPGDGNPPPHQWPEVLRKIAARGKKMQTWGNANDLLTIVDDIKDLASPGIIHFRMNGVPEGGIVREWLGL